MSLYVDADACPVKDECIRAAERLGVRAFLVCNGGLRPSAHPLVEVVFVTRVRTRPTSGSPNAQGPATWW